MAPIAPLLLLLSAHRAWAGTPEWTEVVPASPLLQRQYHMTALTGSSKVWIFGGDSSNGTEKNDLWNIDTQAASPEWTEVAALGSIPLRRQQSSAVLTTSSKLWIFGGVYDGPSGPPLSDMWNIDLSLAMDLPLAVWSRVFTSGPAAHYGHSAVISASGKMWIFGGMDASVGGRNDLWCVDTTASSPAWQQVLVSGNTPPARADHSAVMTATGTMFVFAGRMDLEHFNDLWSIDLEAGVPGWTNSTPADGLPSARSGHSSVVTSSGAMWVYGGMGLTEAGFGPVPDQLWFMDTAVSPLAWNEVSISGSWPTPRYGHGAVMTPAGKMLIVGGVDNASNVLSDLWQLDPDTSTGSVTVTLPSLPLPTTQGWSTTITISVPLTTPSLPALTTSSISLATETEPLSLTSTSILLQGMQSLVSQLAVRQGQGASAEATTDLGSMVAVALDGFLQNSSGTVLALLLDGSPAAAVLPLELVNQASALVLATLNGPGSEDFSAGRRFWTKQGRLIEAVAPAVDITLMNMQTLNVLEVQGATIFYVRIAQMAPDPEWICAFLDGDAWSTDGVRLAFAEELEAAFGDIADTSGVWCATVHLSIFGAFIDILKDCTSATVLSTEGLGQILERRWWGRPPAVALAILLCALLLLLAFGCHRDAASRRSGLWLDEYFLTDLAKKPSKCWLRPGEKQSQELSDSPGLKAAAPAPAELLRRMQQPLAAELKELIVYRNTLWEVAREYSLHPSLIQTHIWGKGGWVQGSLAMQSSPQLRELAFQLEEYLPSAFLRVHASSYQRLQAAMTSTHPVYELCMFDLHITAARRAKIFMDCILGSLVFVALLFSVDGSAVAARSPSECPMQQHSFLWYVFVAAMSVTLNLVPRSLEFCLAQRGFVQESLDGRQQQLQRRRLADAAFWTASICLSVFHLLFVAAFLATLGEVDEWQWMLSFALVLLRKLVVVPVLATTISSVGTAFGTSTLSKQAMVPPKKFGLDMQLALKDIDAGPEVIVPTAGESSQVWLDKVQELAHRAMTIRQLLDFYAELGQTTMEHFDPHSSTTHDVVRQAIIPHSLQLREARSFVVLVQKVVRLAVTGCQPRCEVTVRCGAVSKPWKGGGYTSAAQGRDPVWEEAFLAEEVFHEEGLQFGVLDGHSKEIGRASLPASQFWGGFCGGLQLGDAEDDSKLHIVVDAYRTLEEAREALQKRGSRPAARSKSFLARSLSLRPQRRQRSEDHAKEKEAVELPTSDEQVIVLGCPKSRIIMDASRGVSAEEPAAGYAFADVVNNGRPHLAQKMVTHSWGNKFTYLLAAILADASGAQRYDDIAEQLATREFGKLAAKLRRMRRLDVGYWVCAFCVNQHSGICASPPPTDSTGHAIAACSCHVPKIFEGDPCEMNKFDDMMAFMKKALRKQGRARLEQVVALEPDFSLLTRVWCIAELVEAQELHLLQAAKIHSQASRDACWDKLANIDVRNAKASFPADKELVLGKIDDIADFNSGLQNLVLQILERHLQRNRECSSGKLLDEVVLAAANVAM